MKHIFFPTLINYHKKYLPADILSGLIICLISIPISMGYAQIAGLPAVYGLYGSVFPILIFACLSTSKQFIFGVDAAPAALVGASLLTLGIAPESPEALSIVPILTLFTAIWLLLFALLHAGRLVNYISEPVMGGFISGICCTIILMQVPKLYGGSAGVGELHELMIHLFHTIQTSFSKISLLLGLSTLAILLLSKRLFPKFPMAVVMMGVGALLGAFTDLPAKGVALLPAVAPGLPKFVFPAFTGISVSEAAGMSLPVAIVIMAETLLAEHNFAEKNDYILDDDKELLAFGFGNLIAAVFGCCPINGSVSRTTLNEQYGGKTQVVSLVAGLSMILILLFGTGLIQYLPVPVLTAIVISALIGATEFDLAIKLWRVSRREFYIFAGAFLGVLVLGTIYGVMIGVVLSFVAVIVRAADPPRCFLGLMPGHSEFFNISRFKHTYPIRNVVIYRFSSDLFFANINQFQIDIEGAIKEDTKAVIVDASGIGNIDVTAAKRLILLYRKLKARGIHFYFTEHIAAVNEQLRILGLGEMIADGAVRRTIHLALGDLGLRAPYQIEGEHDPYHSVARRRAESTVQEFVWAYGDLAEEEIEKQIQAQIEVLKQTGDLDVLSHGSFGVLSSIDEDEWLEHLETHLTEIARISGKDELQVAEEFEQRRIHLAKLMEQERPELAKRFALRRAQLDERLKKDRPEVYERIVALRAKHHHE